MLFICNFADPSFSNQGMSRLFSTLVIFLFALFSLYPFAWMFFSSFKTNKEIYQPSQLLPEEFNGQAYGLLLEGKFVDFEGSLWQSLMIASTQAFLATLISALAGFVIARYSFRGKVFLFTAALLLILIPRQALVVPVFEWFNLLGMTGHSNSLILSGLASGLGVIFFAQAFKQLPVELMEVLKIGRSETVANIRVGNASFCSKYGYLFSVAFCFVLAGALIGPSTFG
jgi:multiple sugar transport system permease protein